MSDNLYWLWLSLSCKPRVANLLLQEFSHPYDIYCTDPERIRDAVPSRLHGSIALLLQKDLVPARRTMDCCFMHGIGIMTLGSAAYPAALKQISDPPIVLYYRGKLINFDKEFMISVVGTREMSEYGSKVAFAIAHDIVRAGGIVVSGLARGVDGVAAAGALSVKQKGCKTIAVLGSGHDRIYPPEHKKLADHVIKHGLLISEYPPTSAPIAHHFPERNRIISGLSAGTLVVEGSEGSGALITAQQAFDENRRVFAVPGNIDQRQSFAGNYLIQKGAKVVTCADDILDSFPKNQLRNVDMSRLLLPVSVDRNATIDFYGVVWDAPGKKSRRRSRDKTAYTPAVDEDAFMEASAQTVETTSETKIKKVTSAPPPGLDEDQLAVYGKLTDAGITADEISEESGIPFAKVMTALTMLEVLDCTELLPGGRYRKK